MVLAVQAVLQELAEAGDREPWIGAQEGGQRASVAGTPGQIELRLVLLRHPVLLQAHLELGVARIGGFTLAWRHQ